MALLLQNNFRDYQLSMEDSTAEVVDAEEAQEAQEDLELNEALTEAEEDTEAVDEFIEDTEETIEDVEDLEAIQETIGEQLDDPDYQGLDEVAVESISRIINRLDERRGLDVRVARDIIAQESFNGSVALRRTNTQLAFESIGSVIRNAWEAIKRAIKGAWDAIAEIWNTHFSEMGRLEKALTALHNRARDTEGAPDTSKEVKVPAKLQQLVYNNGNLQISMITDLIKKQKEVTGTANKAVATAIENANKLANGAAVSTLDNKTVNFGTENSVLANGFYGVAEREGEDDKARYKFKTDRRRLEVKKDAKFIFATTNEIQGAVKEAKELLSETRGLGKEYKSQRKKFDEAVGKVDKKIQELEQANAESAKAIKEGLDNVTKSLNSYGVVIPKINSRISRLNLDTIKGLIQFSRVSLKNIKSANKKKK